MRNWSNIDNHYQELLADCYPQPMDTGHLKLLNSFIDNYVLPTDANTILDVGSGDGTTGNVLRRHEKSYRGISIENKEDFNFLDDESYDLLLSRHSLEHSPFPLLTLMEWWRVSNKWLALVLPNPDYYKYVGRNHYSVMEITHSVWLLRRAGWKLVKLSIIPTEYWFLCEKKKRIGYEGWAKTPLLGSLYEFERDLKKSMGKITIPEWYEKL